MQGKTQKLSSRKLQPAHQFQSNSILGGYIYLVAATSSDRQNVRLTALEGTHPLIWQKFPLIWQRRIVIKVSVQYYVSGVKEIVCKYLQSARSKYRLADESTLRAWRLQVRQF